MNDPQKHHSNAVSRVVSLLAQDPPQAENAERALLSCVLQDASCLAVAQDLITSPEVFARPAHVVIWEAVVKVAGAGGEVSLPVIEATITGRGMLDQVGGVDYLIDILDKTEARPTPAITKSMAEAVIDMHIKRCLAELGQRLIIDGHESDDAAMDLLDKAQGEALAISESVEQQGGATGVSTLAEIMAQGEEPEESPAMSTGYYDLDHDMDGGLRPGHLTIIGARPSMGKTSFMMGLAAGMAERGSGVAVYSLEMRRRELADRMLAGKSRVPSRRAPHVLANSMEDLNIQDARRDLASLPLIIDDTPGLSMMQIRARVRRAIATHGVKAVFIDYLQLMTPEKNPSREQQVSALSLGCKNLAREFDVAVVLLSQLNRQAENREGHRPRMSDLRESGSIEQDADEIFLLHRPDYYEKQKDASHVNDGVAEVIIAKQRNGPTGTVRLQFDAECAAMVNAARSDQAAAQGSMEYGEV